ncbi:MAG TPA: hypothetical protein VFZ58_06020 [Candidatus Saccharimonadales bacterium]
MFDEYSFTGVVLALLPDWLLVTGAIVSLIVPTVIVIVADAAVFRRNLRQFNLPVAIIVVCWLISIGWAGWIQIYGHGRRPDLWRFSLGQILNQEPGGLMAAAVIIFGGMHLVVVYVHIRVSLH